MSARAHSWTEFEASVRGCGLFGGCVQVETSGGASRALSPCSRPKLGMKGLLLSGSLDQRAVKLLREVHLGIFVILGVVRRVGLVGWFHVTVA